MSTTTEPLLKHKQREITHGGIKKLHLTPEKLAYIVQKQLKLTFTLQDWQTYLIYRIAEGYDSIFVAGTGYGKSIIFEGLAQFRASKTVIVICPLKVLEFDQVHWPL
jgi:superfamily II DNA helicase RecQ